MKNNYFNNVIDEFSNETYSNLTEEGCKELMCLEKIYISSMSLGMYKKYLSYSDVYKLKYLLRKDKREKKETTTVKEKRISFTDYLQTNPEIDWFSLYYDRLIIIESFLRKNLEDCKSAKELILEDIYKNELSAQMEQC